MGQELLGADAPGEELEIDFEAVAREAGCEPTAPSTPSSFALRASEDGSGSPSPAGGGGFRAPQVPYTSRTARAILVRVAEGESLSAICGEPGAPHRGTVWRWVRAHPAFGEALGRAKAAGGTLARSMQLSTFDAVVAHEICARMGEGEALTAICRDPVMPSYSAVCRWRRTFPEFAAMLEEARLVQAERCCDEALEIAAAVTPETAWATQVRLIHLRWAAGTMAPRTFGKFKAQEPPGETRRQNLIVRHFQVEMREEDGAKRVVSYRPVPGRGTLERVAEGEWEGAYTPDEERYVAWRAWDEARERERRAALPPAPPRDWDDD